MIYPKHIRDARIPTPEVYEIWNKDFTACMARRFKNEIKDKYTKGLNVAGQRVTESGSVIVRIS